MAKVVKSKLGVADRIIERYSISRTGRFLDVIREGWNAYNFIFYIGSIAAIMGILTGWLGLLYIVITILFFYYAGKFKQKVELARKRNEARNRGDRSGRQ